MHAPASPQRLDPAQAALPEADIQYLKEAARLTRHEAVDALRHAGGDAQQAFLNEVDALHLNEAAVDALVREYASFRCAGAGLHPLPCPRPSSSCMCLLRGSAPESVLWRCCSGVRRMCMVCAGSSLSFAD